MASRIIHPMVITIILAVSLAALTGCTSSEDRAEELYSTARFEEKQTNLEHATELYFEILLKYPQTSWGPRATKRLEAIKQYRSMKSKEASGKVLADLKMVVEKGNWDGLETYLFNPESFLWRTCGPGEESEPESSISFEDARARFSRQSRGSVIRVNETVHSEETQFGRFMTIETSGWNDKKMRYLYFIVSEVGYEWKISGICYYPEREPNFKRFMESVG